ncbi:MAG: 30S ribosomal protein S4 [Microgenomates group bacterium GW2011_GWF2_47_9]|nr:MAG: 30S ribosomal protein S4 [Microgenomates group bacterium GW2011_GWF2_47_9]
MARYTGPRNKVARRLGADLGLKTNPKSLERRINTPPGQHGRKGTRKMSDYGIQLAEKQKAKNTYGVLERQFKKYYTIASRTPQATGAVLLALLERRLDNVVYRLGFAPTRRAARQLVTHGNVLVNNKKLSIPSYCVTVDELVSISKKASNIPYIKELLANKEYQIPKWLDRKALVGKVRRLPERDDTQENIQEQLIVEFYSR